MAFLITTTTQPFRLVWSQDSALKASKKGVQPSWIRDGQKQNRSGKKPDVLVCRALNSSEVLRIVTAIDESPSLIVDAACLGVTAIELGESGKVIEEPKEIREILGHAGNLEAVASLAETIVRVSKEGSEALPFRTKGAKVS